MSSVIWCMLGFNDYIGSMKILFTLLMYICTLTDTIWVVIKVEHGGVLGITQQMSTFATTSDVNYHLNLYNIYLTVS